MNKILRREKKKSEEEDAGSKLLFGLQKNKYFASAKNKDKHKQNIKRKAQEKR